MRTSRILVLSAYIIFTIELFKDARSTQHSSQQVLNQISQYQQNFGTNKQNLRENIACTLYCDSMGDDTCQHIAFGYDNQLLSKFLFFFLKAILALALFHCRTYTDGICNQDQCTSGDVRKLISASPNALAPSNECHPQFDFNAKFINLRDEPVCIKDEGQNGSYIHQKQKLQFINGEGFALPISARKHSYDRSADDELEARLPILFPNQKFSNTSFLTGKPLEKQRVRLVPRTKLSNQSTSKNLPPMMIQDHNLTSFDNNQTSSMNSFSRAESLAPLKMLSDSAQSSFNHTSRDVGGQQQTQDNSTKSQFFRMRNQEGLPAQRRVSQEQNVPALNFSNGCRMRDIRSKGWQSSFNNNSAINRAVEEIKNFDQGYGGGSTRMLRRQKQGKHMQWASLTQKQVEVQLQQQTIEQYTRKINKLEQQLKNNKIFLNMVIHDMRNPTNAIEFAIKEVIKVLNNRNLANGDSRNSGQQIQQTQSLNKRNKSEDTPQQNEATQQRCNTQNSLAQNQWSMITFNKVQSGQAEQHIAIKSKFQNFSLANHERRGSFLSGQAIEEAKSREVIFQPEANERFQIMESDMHADYESEHLNEIDEFPEERALDSNRTPALFQSQAKASILSSSMVRGRSFMKESELCNAGPHEETGGPLANPQVQSIFVNFEDSEIAGVEQTERQAIIIEQVVHEQQHQIETQQQLLESQQNQILPHSQNNTINLSDKFCSSLRPAQHSRNNGSLNIHQEEEKVAIISDGVSQSRPMSEWTGNLEHSVDQSNTLHRQLVQQHGPKLQFSAHIDVGSINSFQIKPRALSPKRNAKLRALANQARSAKDLYGNRGKPQLYVKSLFSGPNITQQAQISLSIEEKKQCDMLLRNSLFSSTMLLNLINDLLDLAKIENQQFNLNTTLFNLHDIIQKAIDTLEFSAKQKNIDVSYKFEPQNVASLIQIAGDDNRYLQILLNFLSNALKFTHNGGRVKIETRVMDHQIIAVQDATDRHSLSKECIKNAQKESLEEEVKIGTMYHEVASQEHQIEQYVKFEIRIVDTGPGISKEDQKKLFMNFSRLQDHAGVNKSGTGLGLSICKTLIELMGGSVRVESEMGVGTSFIMELQTKYKDVSALEIQAVMNRLTEKQGPYQEEFKGSPVAKFQDDNTPCFGDALLRFRPFAQLKQSNFNQASSNYPHPFIPRYEQSSSNKTDHSTDQVNFVSPHNREVIQNAALQQIIKQSSEQTNSAQRSHSPAKSTFTIRQQGPTPSAFRRGTFNAESSNAQASSTPQESNEAEVPSSSHIDNESQRMYRQPFLFRVLIANDDGFQLSIISIVMQNCGFEVDLAENGLIAVQKYQHNQGSYDVVILDLDMPIMNGYEACTRMRQRDQRKELKSLFVVEHEESHQIEEQDRQLIVALTGNVTQTVLVQGKQAGFDEIILTPLSETKIKDLILQRLAEQNHQEDFEEQHFYECEYVEIDQQYFYPEEPALS